MSLYNLIYGQNPMSDLLLAVIGLKRHDVERLRDVHVTAISGAPVIAVHTRTGGGNRAEYRNEALRHAPGWMYSEDDGFDSTYCTDYFSIPAEFRDDVLALSAPMENGFRKEFGQHLLKTLDREATDADVAQAQYERERELLKRTKHFMANGHTFVPQDDWAMKQALELAEANGGELRSCWAILPLAIRVKLNFVPYPGSTVGESKMLRRIEVDYDSKWAIDDAYWEHCVNLFGGTYPVTMGKIAEKVQELKAKAA